MRRRRKKKKKKKKKKQEPRSKWHYIDCRGREGAEISSEGFQAASANFRTSGSVKCSIYLSTPSQYLEGNSFLKIFRLCPLILPMKSSSKIKTSMRHW
jgi:hypothetical protein